MGTLKPKASNHGLKGVSKKPSLANHVGRLQNIANAKSAAGRSFAQGNREVQLNNPKAQAAYNKAGHEIHAKGPKRGGGGGGGLFDTLKDIGSTATGYAMDAIDIPRDAVVSSLASGWRATQQLASGEGDLGDVAHAALALGTATPLAPFTAAANVATDPKARKSFSKHEGFAQQMGIDTGNSWANLGIGLAGDIALDPLTYVGGAGIAREGAKASAETLSRAAVAAKVLDKADTAETAARAAAKVGRMGYGSLTKGEKAILADQHVLQARIAATAPEKATDVERKLASAMGIELGSGTPQQLAKVEHAAAQAKRGGAFFGLGQHKVPIPGTVGLTDKLNAVANKTFRPIRGAVGDVVAENKAVQALRGTRGELLAAARDTEHPWRVVASTLEDNIKNVGEALKASDGDANLKSAMMLLDSVGNRSARHEFVNDKNAIKAINEGTAAAGTPEREVLDWATGLRSRVTGQTKDAYSGPIDIGEFKVGPNEGINHAMERYARRAADLKGNSYMADRLEAAGMAAKSPRVQEKVAADAEKISNNAAAEAATAEQRATGRLPGVDGSESYNVWWKDNASGRAGTSRVTVSKDVGNPVQRKRAAEQIAYNQATPGNEGAFQIQRSELIPGRQRVEDRLANVLQGDMSPAQGQRITEMATRDGGITFNPRTGDTVQGGFAVGALPNGTGIAGQWEGPADQLAQGISAVRQQHADLFNQDPNVFQGVWHNKDTGKMVVDPVRRAYSPEEAVTIARQNGQHAIWDMNAGHEINLDALDAGDPVAVQRFQEAVSNTNVQRTIDFSAPEKSISASTAQGRDELHQVADNALMRIDALDMPKLEGWRKREFGIARGQLEQAKSWLEHFAGQNSPEAEAAGYLAQADIAFAHSVESGVKAWDAADAAKAIRDHADWLANELGHGLKKFAATGRMVDEDLARALAATAKLEERNAGLKFYDHMLAVIKGYQIGTLGFHTRNFLGGAMNNWLDGVNPLSYTRWRSATKAAEDGFDSPKWLAYEGKNPEVAKGFRVMNEKLKAVGHGQIGSESVIHGDASLAQKINPMSPEFAWFRLHHTAGEKVETYLRGAAGLDWLVKHPGDLDGAMRRIYKLHFNYKDLSAFEKGVVKRVMPFYTWTRYNVPLQVEMLVRRPGVYNHYQQLRNNIERMSPADSIVPSWYADQRMLRLPWTKEGGHVYWNVGAPQEDILSSEFTDPQKYIGLVNPMLKTPVELARGKKFFGDIPLGQKEMIAPKAWTLIPGLMPVLRAAGVAKEGKDGWHMTDQNIYTVEQFLPALGQARRLVPGNDPKAQDQAMFAWARMLGFTGLRANTRRERRNERLRRKYEGR